MGVRDRRGRGGGNSSAEAGEQLGAEATGNDSVDSI